MSGLLFGLALGLVADPPPAAGGASLRAADEQRPHRRDSHEDRRPAGRSLEMGPASTALALLALSAAIVSRRRRFRAG